MPPENPRQRLVDPAPPPQPAYQPVYYNVENRRVPAEHFPEPPPRQQVSQSYRLRPKKVKVILWDGTNTNQIRKYAQEQGIQVDGRFFQEIQPPYWMVHSVGRRDIFMLSLREFEDRYEPDIRLLFVCTECGNKQQFEWVDEVVVTSCWDCGARDWRQVFPGEFQD